MQIIFVSGRFKTAKTVAIMPRHVVSGVVALLALVILGAVAVSWLSVRFRLPVVQDLVLAAQQQENRQTQEFMRSNLQLMATRLGEMQAQLVQLDNLGDKISALTGIKREPGRNVGQGGPFIAAPLSADELQKEIDRLGQEMGNRSDELNSVASRLLEKRLKDHLLPTSLPVKQATIGSGFGQRIDPFSGQRAVHEGIDFNAEPGTPVYAAAGGVVLVAERHPDFGNMVDIDHGEGLVSRYAHLSRTLVKPGQLLRRGELIGEVGSTGRSTGSHLHFEVRMMEAPQNPVQFLKRNEDFARLKTR